MIVPKKNSTWAKLVFSVNGTIATKIWKRLLAVCVFAVVVTVLDHNEFVHNHNKLKIAHFNLITLALSIFLGFRNNTSYDRFWEGRKLWGGVVNMSRNFVRQTYSFICREEAQEFQKRLSKAAAAYPHLLRMHLRSEWEPEKVQDLIPKEVCDSLLPEQNRPIALLHWMGMELQIARKKEWLHVYQQPFLEKTLSTLCDLQGGCERIRATPIPYSYNVLLHRIVALYCFTLPFGVVGELGILTPLVVGIVSYAFLGLDAIGDEIENPFERAQNDLPLDAIAHMIESNIRQRIGEEPLELLKPDPDTQLLL